MNKAPEVFSKAWAIQATREIKDKAANWDYVLEVFADEAKSRRARFDAHKKAGFTDEQAITLIK